MGSATLTPSARLATSVASWLAPARCLLKLSALPPSTYRLPITSSASPALQQRQHLRQLRLVVLQIGVDHGGKGRAGGKDALDAGAGQAAAADAADAAHARILLREVAHHLPGAVGRVVVDEHDLPRRRAKGRRQPLVQRGDVVALVEGRDDHRNDRQAQYLGELACTAIPEPGLTASFMRDAYSGRPPRCQGGVPRKCRKRPQKSAQNGRRIGPCGRIFANFQMSPHRRRATNNSKPRFQRKARGDSALP